MDRARSSHFIWQLPRTAMDLVLEQEQVEDKQVLLNETWPHYCDRFDGCREVERGQGRQKWVTETWEEYENRIPKREANIHRFFRRQAIRDDAVAADMARREAAAERTLAEIRSREHRRKIRFLPTLNTLLRDPLKELEAQSREEQVEIMKEERKLRRLVEDEQFRKMCQAQYEEDQQRRWLEAELERRKREEEERQRQREEEERRRKEEEEEARRRQEEEERRQQQEELNRQKEEALRKRRELEERRRAEQLRMKEERERQKKAEEEAEALRRRLAEQQEQQQQEQVEVPTQEEPKDIWTPVREDQTSRMAAFLADLKARAEGADTVAALEQTMDWAVQEMGAFMSSFAFYIGLLDGSLRYKYASEACSAKMRSGACFLDPDTHGSCPTMATIIGKLEEVFVGNAHSQPDIVFLGDGSLQGADAGEGDFFGLPIVCNDGEVSRCVGVLGADTLTCNGGGEAWQSAHPEGPRPRPMDEAEKQFLREVASVFSTGFSTLSQRPAVEETTPEAAPDLVADLRAFEGADSSIGKVLGAGLAAIGKYLNSSGMNGYISRPNHSCSTLSVIYQFAGGKVYGMKDTGPPQEALGRHTFMVGKKLASTSHSLSFQLLSEGAPTHLYCPDVSQSDNVAVYGGGAAKQSDCLLVATITLAGAAQPFAVLGVEAPADPGISEQQVGDLLRVAQMLGELIRPLRLREQTSGVCKQVIQWLEATTGVRNVYISVPEGLGLRYIAANKGNEGLVGKMLDATEGVSHDVWEAEGGEIFIKDLKAEAENGGRVKFWVEEHKGQPGQCLFTALKSEDGTPLAVLGCDTLGGSKLTISEEDRRVIRKSAALLTSIFDEISAGTLDDLTDDVNLQIEELVGAGGVRFYKKVLLDVLLQLGTLTKDQLLEVARYNSPPELVVKVVSGTLVVLQHKPRLVKEWDACRKHVKQPLIDKMKSFDATKEGKKRKNFFRRAKIMLKGLDMQTVFEKGSLPASLFFQWSYVSIQLRYLADRLRRQAQEGTLDLGDDEEDRTEEEGGEEGDGEGDDETDAGTDAGEAEAEVTTEEG